MRCIGSSCSTPSITTGLDAAYSAQDALGAVEALLASNEDVHAVVACELATLLSIIRERLAQGLAAIDAARQAA